MKIVVITNYWRKSPGGGVTTFLTNLVNELENRNIRVHVIFKFGSDPQNHHITGNKIMFFLKSYLSLTKIKPDIIHSQGTWYCLLPGYIYKKTHPVNLIHTFHTEPTKKLPFFSKMFFQQLLYNCEYVTFVSKSLKEKIKAIYGMSFRKTEITYAGINFPPDISEKEICAFRKLFGIKENSVILLANGFTSYKSKADGAKLLIKAVKILKRNFPNIILILTKEGPFSNELKKFSQAEKMSDSIIFTGTLENTSVPLNICDIYTHTPLIEGGVSLSVLEAMAMGKPILATSIGGILEAIEDGVNGILVQPDVDLIAQKISYLLKNKEFAFKLGQNAQKTAEEKFSWKMSVDTFLKLYTFPKN